MSTAENKRQMDTVSSSPPPFADPRELTGDPADFVKQYLKLGPIFQVPRYGPPLIVLAGPEANAFISHNGGKLLSSTGFWKDFDHELGAVKPAHEGEAHRRRRAILGHGYSRGVVTNRIPFMVEIARQLMQSWQPGQNIAVVSSMQRIVAEQLSRLLVHYSPGDYVEDFVTFLYTAIIATLDKSQHESALANPAYQKARERVKELGRAIIAAHRDDSQSHTHEPDLMDEVLAAATKDPGEFADGDLVVAALGPLIAGVDTVANSCGFMIYALLKQADIFQRVLAEIDQAFAQGPLTWEVVRNMHDLRNAAMETMRLYPVAGGHLCTAAHPFTFEGYQVKQGEDVYVAMTVSHFLPELFPDPETFDIDRYTEPRNEHRKRGAFAPFGLGEHACLGSGIAELQLMVILATLLHDFQIQLLTPDAELKMVMEPTPSPGHAFQVHIASRREHPGG